MSNITDGEILPALAEIVHQVVGVPVEQVVPDASFTDDLTVDSLSLLEIAVGIEEKFGLRVPDDQVAGLLRVSDAVEFIRSALV
ncbi:acyl carrier protein [Nocardioides cavernaquae]|uniref:Acyl carrier protein n=1 Tax=Nocardioides cavernaquae TaxID=2321396 RepID=A0A3A5HAC9_9ACTN|nr:acyl carrier protein [Nocardioides cavernaquae]RJS47586.1 acyl carrier protein [Nocardioides cavernaquae]